MQDWFYWILIVSVIGGLYWFVFSVASEDDPSEEAETDEG